MRCQCERSWPSGGARVRFIHHAQVSILASAARKKKFLREARAMESMQRSFLGLRLWSAALCLIVTGRSGSSSRQTHLLRPGFQGSQMNWIDNNGIFLLSNNSIFAFGFVAFNSAAGIRQPTSFQLSVLHQPSSTVVWTANRRAPVTQSDNFIFDKKGNAYLASGTTIIWSTNTSGKGATALALHDSGDLTVLGTRQDLPPLWQSFLFPTDTLLSGQNFVEGMSLISQPASSGSGNNNNKNNMTYRIQIVSGDMILYADFASPQPYWSMRNDERKIANKLTGALHSATLVGNSWDLYDAVNSLLWQFVFRAPAPTGNNGSLIWAAVLGNDGFLSFYSLQQQLQGSTGPSSSTRIPQDPCGAPESCLPYYICYSGPRCQCPAVLSSDSDCNPHIISPCTSPSSSFDLAKLEDGVGYFSTSFTQPWAKSSNVVGCKDMCITNCSCVAMAFDENSNDCFLFDEIGSFRQQDGSTTFATYVKISSESQIGAVNGQAAGIHSATVVVTVVVATGTALIVIISLLFCITFHKKRAAADPSDRGVGEEEEDDNLFEKQGMMPVRFTYKELEAATDNFSIKLGQGGFGSVYLGRLPDGGHVAVKKLEGIGQGKKEFRAEVSIIGSIHHIHLVRLRGFCADGAHRLLAYDYMAKGSLDRWIFQSRSSRSSNNTAAGHEEEHLDWDRRFSIALGTAKGLAYLHEDCDAKIVHCDIKPENVLLDDQFVAKVSDFGLAKLMSREQSHFFTTLRGTRGYLAPEWITNYAISEKSDVYSYGMVLLEIIGGRKNYDPSAECSDKAHFPSYAFKKMEQGKLGDLLDDAKKPPPPQHGNVDPTRLETAIKVALWCIQEDMYLRPSMTKVVQMLEGVTDVPSPPNPHVGFSRYAKANMTMISKSEGESSSSDYNSDAFLSAVRLSGPR